ncbi:hypothetical protein PRZ48_008074 [Zasmidium cellare]|uniref:Uncharacterized protein n=1 Tax=Zasmidium cellare TaxID=395010 RepID=A0ABR0EFK6_ZASCE|nr:hypothetical protein PRZ48_008074 [Zasmidium cellare]
MLPSTCYSNPLRGPLAPYQKAQLSMQVAFLESALPHLHDQLQQQDASIASSQSAMALCDEYMATQTERAQAFDSTLTEMEANLPSNFANRTVMQCKHLNYQAFQFNANAHSVLRNGQCKERHVAHIKDAGHNKKLIQRRIDIIHWRIDTFVALSDPAAMTTFPTPPKIGSCRDKSHDKQSVCACHIRAAFWLLNRMSPVDFKAERALWQPLRFATCQDELKPEFKKLAKEISAVLAAMDIGKGKGKASF